MNHFAKRSHLFWFHRMISNRVYLIEWICVCSSEKVNDNEREREITRACRSIAIMIQSVSIDCKQRMDSGRREHFCRINQKPFHLLWCQAMSNNPKADNKLKKIKKGNTHTHKPTKCESFLTSFLYVLICNINWLLNRCSFSCVEWPVFI